MVRLGYRLWGEGGRSRTEVDTDCLVSSVPLPLAKADGNLKTGTYNVTPQRAKLTNTRVRTYSTEYHKLTLSVVCPLFPVLYPTVRRLVKESQTPSPPPP